MTMLDEDVDQRGGHDSLSRRDEIGAYDTIFLDLGVEDTPRFSEYMRMPFHYNQSFNTDGRYHFDCRIYQQLLLLPLRVQNITVTQDTSPISLCSERRDKYLFGQAKTGGLGQVT